MIAIGSVASFLLGIFSVAAAQWFPNHVARLETAAGFLFIATFMLIGSALPMFA